MPNQTKRDALEALICEQIMARVESVRNMEPDHQMEQYRRGKRAGLVEATLIIRRTFQECQ